MFNRPPLLTALVLLIAALGGAPAASAHDADDGGTDFAAAWTGIKASLKEGDVAAARATYDQTFAAGAVHHALAQQQVDAAFAALDGRDDTGSAFYNAQAQLVDKSVYAIAYANVQHAVAEGDLDAAAAWFGVLEAKFSGATDLAGAKVAFAELTKDTAAAALATLDVEYRDVILAKVIKETDEAPLLLESEPVTAAKEAAEGLGYYLSIQPEVATILGADAEATLRNNLVHLLDETLEESDDITATVAEMEELRDLIHAQVATFALATTDTGKADAFASYKTLLKNDKDLAAARAVYDAEFAHAAEETVPATHERVLQAFTDAQTALDESDATAYTVKRQILEKSIFHVALEAFAHEAMEGEVDEALAYYLVLVQKFGWSDDLPAGVLAAAHMSAANKATDDRIAAAQAVAYDAFFGKVREEVEEVFMNWDDNPEAQEKAIEGVVYFAPLKADVETRLGAAVATELEKELLELFEATAALDNAKAQAVAEEVEALLLQYEADGETVSELSAVVSKLKGKVDFVAEEFRGYYEAKEIGDEDEAAIEMGEAKAFLKGARDQFQANVAEFEAVDTAAVAQVTANFDAMQAILDEVGDLAELEALAEETVALLNGFTAAPVEYAGEVTAAFGKATVKDDQVMVPLKLVGLPEDGAAFQFNVKFDTATLEAVDAKVLFGDVKASDIDNDKGVVRFNAASTGKADIAGAVAQLVFTLKTADATAFDLELEAEEIVDAQNRPYRLASVEGGAVDLTDVTTANAGANTEDGVRNESPAPAVPIVLAALALLGLAVRGRKED